MTGQRPIAPATAPGSSALDVLTIRAMTGDDEMEEADGGPRARSDSDDELLDLLDELEQAVTENIRRNEAVLDRVVELRALHARGLSMAEILHTESRPLILDWLRANLEAIHDAGGRLRRYQAEQLYREGLSQYEIADRLGVTRQRVAALLARR